MFLCDNHWRFRTFSILKLWNKFSEKQKPFPKNCSTVFSWKYWDWKQNIFIQKLPCQKPMLRQIEWRVQNGPITKNGVLPVFALFFWKFNFSIRTFYKELIQSTTYQNVHIHVFLKRLSFIFGCIFPVASELTVRKNSKKHFRRLKK